MFKSIIKKLVKNVVRTGIIIAEQEFGSGKGTEKKQFAVNYIIKKIAIPAFIKNPLATFLFEVIDEAVEYAVMKFNAENEQSA